MMGAVASTDTARMRASVLSEARRERALRFGAGEVLDPTSQDLAALDPQVDAFVAASGASAAVRAGIGAVGPGGRVVLVGMGAVDLDHVADALDSDTDPASLKSIVIP